MSFLRHLWVALDKRNVLMILHDMWCCCCDKSRRASIDNSRKGITPMSYGYGKKAKIDPIRVYLQPQPFLWRAINFLQLNFLMCFPDRPQNLTETLVTSFLSWKTIQHSSVHFNIPSDPTRAQLEWLGCVCFDHYCGQPR